MASLCHSTVRVCSKQVLWVLHGTLSGKLYDRFPLFAFQENFEPPSALLEDRKNKTPATMALPRKINAVVVIVEGSDEVPQASSRWNSAEEVKLQA
jgi:hypothetical protein